MIECNRCILHKTRTQIVYGSGSLSANLMFIGEAPGYWEDKKCIPFVGQSGKILDHLIDSIGLHRKDVYITNVIKCRPPNNRDPKPEEIEECRYHLRRQIRKIDPKIICTLGRFASTTILGRKISLKLLHGKVFINAKRKVMPMYHPAYAIYNRDNISILERDFQQLLKLLR